MEYESREGGSVTNIVNDLHSGKQYRIDPARPTRIQVKPGSRQRWRTHSTWHDADGYTGAEWARRMLLSLGQRDAPDVPDYDVTNWVDEDGVQHWSEDGQP